MKSFTKALAKLQSFRSVEIHLYDRSNAKSMAFSQIEVARLKGTMLNSWSFDSFRLVEPLSFCRWVFSLKKSATDRHVLRAQTAAAHQRFAQPGCRATRLEGARSVLSSDASVWQKFVEVKFDQILRNENLLSSTRLDLSCNSNLPEIKTQSCNFFYFVL